MRVLIGCEESGTVRESFKLRGHDAWSCDILPTRKPGQHLQKDIKLAIIENGTWDLIILHPDCTKIAVSGNRWYGSGMPRHKERLDAITWTVDLWNLAKNRCKAVILENPVSVVFSHLENKTLQYIQPWQFGHGETKKTGLALYGVERLEPTNIVEGREQRIWKMAPSPTRKRDRSETFQGIADAMADQWGQS